MYIIALPQYEATKAYMAKEPDELSLQQAEVVIVSQEADGKDQETKLNQIKTKLPHQVGQLDALNE